MTKEDTYCVDSIYHGGKYVVWQYSNYSNRKMFDSLEQCIIFCDLIGMDLIEATTGKYINKHDR